jgi:hypothetical protein
VRRANKVKNSNSSVFFDFKETHMNIEEIIKTLELDPEPRSSRPDWTRTFDEDEEVPIEVTKDTIYKSDIDDWDLPRELVEELFDIACSDPKDQVEPVDEEAIWDICAWYQPIHFFGRHWGVYIREKCLRTLALRIAGIIPPRNIRQTVSNKNLFAKDLMLAAFSAIFLHEHFHHKVESLGIRLHVVLGHPVYEDYKKNVYSRVFKTDDCLEEALANAYSYHRINDETYSNFNYPHLMKGVVQGYLQQKFPYEPPGYRRAIDYLTGNKFKTGLCLLQGQVKEGRLNPLQPSHHWLLAPYLTRPLFNFKSSPNLFVVVPKGQKSCIPIYRVP